MAWPLGINVATSQPLGIPKALSGTVVTDINPSCSCGRPQTQTQPLAAAQDQTASRSPVASRPPISTPFFTVFVSPDLPLSTGNKLLLSLTPTNMFVHHNGVRLPGTSRQTRGLFYLPRVAYVCPSLPTGPNGAEPNIFLFLLPNYRYSATHPSLSRLHGGLCP